MKFNRTLRIDGEGGLYIDENNRLQWIDGQAGVAQELKTRLASVRGEDPFHPEFGLRIFEVTGAPAEVLRREVRATLLEDDRVDAVNNIGIDRRAGERVFDVDVEVTLVDGTSVGFNTEVNA